MKLAKELIGLISNYYALNKLGLKMSYPANQEYVDILKPDVVKSFLVPLGYTTGDVEISYTKYDGTSATRYKTFEEELKEVPNELLTRLDLVLKGSIFLYLNEILSWDEVKVLLNIGSTGVSLYKIAVEDDLGAYDIILSLLSVLFGKVSYDTDTVASYTFKRLTTDRYYWDQPMYYYGYKIALSYSNLDAILDNIDWFISENPEVQTLGVPNRYDILGMIRINNKFTKFVIEDNELEETISTEMQDLGLYNIALNLIKVDDTTYGLGNVLFDYYKAIKETTSYNDIDDVFTEIDWTVVGTYCKYIDTVIDLDTNHSEIEKTGNIIRNIQNFLIH